jgi:hypothetical protein
LLTGQWGHSKSAQSGQDNHSSLSFNWEARIIEITIESIFQGDPEYHKVSFGFNIDGISSGYTKFDNMYKSSIGQIPNVKIENHDLIFDLRTDSIKIVDNITYVPAKTLGESMDRCSKSLKEAGFMEVKYSELSSENVGNQFQVSMIPPSNQRKD